MKREDDLTAALKAKYAASGPLGAPPKMPDGWQFEVNMTIRRVFLFYHSVIVDSWGLNSADSSIVVLAAAVIDRYNCVIESTGGRIDWYYFDEDELHPEDEA